MPCNPYAAGPLQCHPNLGSRYDAAEFDVYAARSAVLGQPPPVWRTISCVVSTTTRMPISEMNRPSRLDDYTTALFTARAAIELEVDFSEIPIGCDTIRQPDGRLFEFYYCECELSLLMGPRYFISGVPVRFPVDVVRFGPGMQPLDWRPRYGFPQQNIVLMRAVLNQCSLLFNAAGLYGYNL